MFFKLLTCVVFILPILVHAKSFELIDWKKNSLTKVKYEINELEGLEYFETEKFKIVIGRSNEAIPINEQDESILLKAATVFYHISKASNYFDNLLTPRKVREQIVIRLEMTDDFDQEKHFSDNDSAAKYNNAKSIPPGPIRLNENAVKPWGHEIWFRPEVLDVKKSTNEAQVNELASIYDMFNKSDAYVESLKLIAQLIKGDNVDLEQGVEEIAVDYFIEQFKKEAFRNTLHFFNYGAKYLNSALIPGVIYHEYAHVALAEYLDIKRSNPINEGFANYFASRILGKEEVSVSFSKYSLSTNKDGSNKDKYIPDYELLVYAQHDFTFSVLHQISQLIENYQISATETDLFFINVAKNLQGSTRINPDLIELIDKQCRSDCNPNFTLRMQILELMTKRGL